MLDWLTLLQSAFLGLVEGLTEFLPVSSTGHLIVVASLINFPNALSDTFVISIQVGAILAVCWHYRERLTKMALELFSSKKEQHLIVNTGIAFLPAALLGVCFASDIKAVLFHPVPVAIALVIGGVIILTMENRHKQTNQIPRIQTIDDLTPIDALKVGCAQCLALIPGTSRSGATIIGGLFFGLSRKAATEFSFFLAMPTIFGATVWNTWEALDTLSSLHIPALLTGTIMSFVSALLVVRWLLHYVSKHDFKLFGWYRIGFGIVILLTHYAGLIAWS